MCSKHLHLANAFGTGPVIFPEGLTTTCRYWKQLRWLGLCQAVQHCRNLSAQAVQHCQQELPKRTAWLHEIQRAGWPSRECLQQTLKWAGNNISRQMKKTITSICSTRIMGSICLQGKICLSCRLVVFSLALRFLYVFCCRAILEAPWQAHLAENEVKCLVKSGW